MATGASGRPFFCAGGSHWYHCAMLDSWIIGFDRALRTLTGLAQSIRSVPGAELPEPDRAAVLVARSWELGTSRHRPQVAER